MGLKKAAKRYSNNTWLLPCTPSCSILEPILKDLDVLWALRKFIPDPNVIPMWNGKSLKITPNNKPIKRA